MCISFLIQKIKKSWPLKRLLNTLNWISIIFKIFKSCRDLNINKIFIQSLRIPIIYHKSLMVLRVQAE